MAHIDIALIRHAQACCDDSVDAAAPDWRGVGWKCAAGGVRALATCVISERVAGIAPPLLTPLLPLSTRNRRPGLLVAGNLAPAP